MTPIDRLLAAFLWLLGVLTVAGITHILAIFALPEAAAKDPYAQIFEHAKLATLSPLPPTLPDQQVIPFADPAMVRVLCPFDLSQGGVRLHADVEGDRLLSFSFRTRAGRIFYAMTDLAAQQGKMDLVVLTPAQLEAVEAGDDEENPPQDLRLIAPETQGSVIISALVAYPAERNNTEERLKSISCQVEAIAQD